MRISLVVLVAILSQSLKASEPETPNLSSFYLWISAPAHALVIDPIGRHIGFDPPSGKTVNEIPSADAFVEEKMGTLDDDGEAVSSAPEVSGYVVQIDDPIPGDYQVNVRALPGQAYVLDVRGFDRNAKSKGNILRSILKAGEHHLYTFAYDPEPSAMTLTLNPITDPTGDGVVDCNDIRRVKEALGKKYGVPGYDSRVDTVTDGVVDIRDLAFVSHQLPAGTTCE